MKKLSIFCAVLLLLVGATYFAMRDQINAIRSGVDSADIMMIDECHQSIRRELTHPETAEFVEYEDLKIRYDVGYATILTSVSHRYDRVNYTTKTYECLFVPNETGQMWIIDEVNILR